MMIGRVLLVLSGMFLLNFCGGCQAMKRVLNDEPRKRPRPRPVQAPEQREVFPGSRKGHGNRPSFIKNELTDQERDAMRQQTQENRFPQRDFEKFRKEDKAASDWVFGR